MTDRIVDGCSSVEDQQVYWVDRDKSFAQMVGQRVARVTMRRTLNTETGSKKKPWPNLIRGACRARAFVLGCNTVAGRPG